MNESSIKLDYSELRGRIKSKLGTEGAFAKAIGRTPQYVSQVLNGKKFFSVKDVVKACEVLEIQNSEVGFFFYSI